MYHACLKKLLLLKRKKKLKSTKRLRCIFLLLPLLLSAFPSLHRSLSSISDRTWETCASSNVWLHFSFCWQSKESERDNPATRLHLAQCYTNLQPQKKLFSAKLWETVREKLNSMTNWLQVLNSNRHLSWPVINIQVWDKIRNQVKQRQLWPCVCVWLSVMHSIRGRSVMDCLPANRLFVNFVNVAVRCMFVCLWLCVHVSLQTSGWYLVSGVSAVDI